MSANYIINGRVDPSGNLTDQAAKNFAAANDVDYATALKAIVKHERKQYAGDNREWPMPNDVNVPTGIATAYRSLANIAATAGRDPAEGARRINATFSRDVIQAAAQYCIEREKERIVANLSPGRTDENLGSAYRQAGANLPNTWDLYNGRAGEITPEACREMFTGISYKLENGEARVTKYSADAQRIRCDANGNQFRTYSFDR